MYVNVPFRSSTCIKGIEVDLLNKKAKVTFKNGNEYEYSNVSKRAIANLLFNPDVSLGFWVNNNCINSERAYETSTPRALAVRRLKRMLKEPQLPAFA
tara:strand:- start:1283 stop:1576 length:294 start_codon:yes stop_codon:yes gene_type:complete